MRNAFIYLVFASNLALTPAANALFIDDFNGGDATIVSPPDASGNFTYAPGGPLQSGAIGGSHTVTVDYISGSSFTAAEVNSFGSGIFSVTNDSDSRSVVSVIWDGNGSGLGGFDLTDGIGNDRLTFFFASLELGTFDINVTIGDTSGNSASRNLGFAQTGEESVLFSSFIDNQGASTNFSQTNTIRLDVANSPTGFGMSLDYIVTDKSASSIPLPGSISLLILGIGGITTQRYRRNKMSVHVAVQKKHVKC